MSFAPRFHRARVGLPVRRLPEKRHEDDVNGGPPRPPWGWGESRKVRAGFRGLHKCSRPTSPRAAIFTFNSREIALNVAGSGTCRATISKMSLTSAPANSFTISRSQRSPRSRAICNSSNPICARSFAARRFSPSPLPGNGGFALSHETSSSRIIRPPRNAGHPAPFARVCSAFEIFQRDSPWRMDSAKAGAGLFRDFIFHSRPGEATNPQDAVEHAGGSLHGPGGGPERPAVAPRCPLSPPGFVGRESPVSRTRRGARIPARSRN